MKSLSDYEYYRTEKGAQYNGEVLEVLKAMPDESINCVITSPPYWGLRDYNVENQLGLEKTFQQYIDRMILIFNEVKRVLKKDGTCWVNLGDTYGGSGKGAGSADNGQKEVYVPECKPDIDDKEYSKCLCQIPSRFAIAMTDNGWILRNEIIWHKPNCMPSSIADRFTVDVEKIFFFVKSKKYWFEQQFDVSKNTEDDIRRLSKSSQYKHNRQGGNSAFQWNNRKINKSRLMSGKNKRTLWSINTKPFPESHFAVFPEKLIETPLKAGCPKDGIVMDIFSGSGTVGLLAERLGYQWRGIELNREYCEMSKRRISKEADQVKMF